MSISMAALANEQGGKLPVLDVGAMKQFDHIPSVSAQCWQPPTLFAVGDDSPAIYAFDKDLILQREIDLSEHVAQDDGRVDGDVKADIEACEHFDLDDTSVLVMLGSGTRTDTRERALLFYPDSGEQQWRNVRPFYRYLREVAGFDNTQFINIEGLTRYNGRVYLLSRGSHGPNVLFSLMEDDWLHYLSGASEQLPEVKAQVINLPALAEREATLSGATYHAASGRFLFTASVDKHDDGGIIGSLLVAVPESQLTDNATLNLSDYSYRIRYQQNDLASKVESVVITDFDGSTLSGILAADNDDGSSQFMPFSLAINE